MTGQQCVQWHLGTDELIPTQTWVNLGFHEACETVLNFFVLNSLRYIELVHQQYIELLHHLQHQDLACCGWAWRITGLPSHNADHQVI